MLQSFLIFTASGMVVFNHQFVAQREVQRMVGALLRSICAVAERTTGMRLELLEYSTTTVSVVSIAETGGLYCAVISERDVPRNVSLGVGRLFGGKVLAAFVDDYGAELEAAAGHSLAAYKGFSARLPQVVRECVRSVLQGITAIPGVDGACAVSDDGVLAESVLAPTAPAELDDVAILTSARPMLVAATDLLLGDGVVRMSMLLETKTGAATRGGSADVAQLQLVPGILDAPSSARVMIWRFPGASLVVHARGHVGEGVVAGAAGVQIELLNKLLALTPHLRRSGTAAAVGSAGVMGMAPAEGGALFIGADGDVEGWASEGRL